MGAEGGYAPQPVKISHKKTATKGGRIDFMFLAPFYSAAGSATEDAFALALDEREWTLNKVENDVRKAIVG